MRRAFNGKNRKGLILQVVEMFNEVQKDSDELDRSARHWFLRAFTRNPQNYSRDVTDMYRKLANEDLKLRTEIVQVKKGKKRYSLLIMVTPQGKLRFNLGRHFEDTNLKVA